MVLLSWIDALLDWAKLIGYDWYLYLKWIAGQLMTIIFALLVLLWISVFLYGGFYYIYMPSVVHTREVNLQFRSDCDSDIRLCSFPSANVSLTPDRHPEPTLIKGQPYVVLFTMSMPESLVNREIGMFMVNIKLYSKNGEITKTSSRSAMLKYKSSLHHTLATWCFLPTLLFGSREEKQDVTVELFNKYQEDPYKYTAGFYIEVQSKKIEIYDSSIMIHARFSGLRYLLFTYPVTAAVFGISTNMFFLVLMYILSWQRIHPKEQTASLAPRFITLEERKKKVKARLDREKQAKQTKEDGEQNLEINPAASLDTSILTEAVEDVDTTESSEQGDEFEQVYHTSEDNPDTSLSEGVRHRSNVPQT